MCCEHLPSVLVQYVADYLRTSVPIFTTVLTFIHDGEYCHASVKVPFGGIITLCGVNGMLQLKWISAVNGTVIPLQLPEEEFDSKCPPDLYLQSGDILELADNGTVWRYDLQSLFRLLRGSSSTGLSSNGSDQISHLSLPRKIEMWQRPYSDVVSTVSVNGLRFVTNANGYVSLVSDNRSDPICSTALGVDENQFDDTTIISAVPCEHLPLNNVLYRLVIGVSSCDCMVLIFADLTLDKSEFLIHHINVRIPSVYDIPDCIVHGEHLAYLHYTGRSTRLVIVNIVRSLCILNWEICDMQAVMTLYENYLLIASPYFFVARSLSGEMLWMRSWPEKCQPLQISVDPFGISILGNCGSLKCSLYRLITTKFDVEHGVTRIVRPVTLPKRLFLAEAFSRNIKRRISSDKRRRE